MDSYGGVARGSIVSKGYETGPTYMHSGQIELTCGGANLILSLEAWNEQVQEMFDISRKGTWIIAGSQDWEQRKNWITRMLAREAVRANKSRDSTGQ